MGSSASKASRAAGAAIRQYPPRSATSSFVPKGETTASSTTQRPSPGPTVRPPPRASSSRNKAINLDASDPHFAQSLRSIGPVQPNPTLSHTSAFPQAATGRSPESHHPTLTHNPRMNSAIAVLEARTRIQEAADAEFMEAGVHGHKGRQFLDAFTIRNILVQRDEYGRSPAQIEKTLGLKEGVVVKLGPKNLVGIVSEQGRAQQGVELV